ncbi:MAG: PadR family transcriptional regulator [Candidatus Micrarchaeota archaeon]
MIIDTNLLRAKDFEKKLTNHKLSVFLLWLISGKSMHGYDIIKTMRSDPVIVPIAASKVYPLLAGLSRKGLVAHKTIMHGKRAKKLYHVTPKGKEVLSKAKACMRRSPLMMRFVKEMLG